ncbi:uncharacterized protein [Leptinotarsa decemlineata]|uniref:uncharacterized protein n=1 Tax=Leptinotarsa decemlineata TaxID=7539 RepID=UPI003D30616A
MLTDRSRIQLVNIVANVFYEKYGSAVPKSVKMECAKKLVEIFPMYKNLESSTRGYEIFFNPSTNGGYLANRLRTLNRINEIERNNPPVKHLHDQNVSITSEEMNLTEELQENLDILKAIPSSETNKIKSLFFETFEYRKSLINKGSAMEIFPKFHETVGLIEQEFLLMFPSYIASFKANYLDAIEKILKIFENTSRSRLRFQSYYTVVFCPLENAPTITQGQAKEGYCTNHEGF